jgi:CBS domain-containing protein
MPAIAKSGRIVEIMTREPITVERDTTIRQLARLFEEFEISGAPVIDDNGVIVGVVSKTDLIRQCMEGTLEEAPGYLFELLSEQADEDVEMVSERIIQVQDFMSTDLVTATPDESIATVARRLAEARVHRAIVIDPQRRPVGIVTSLDILSVFPR